VASEVLVMTTRYDLKIVPPDQWPDSYHFDYGYVITAYYSDDDPLATSPWSVIRQAHGYKTRWEAELFGKEAMDRVLAGEEFNKHPRSVIA
jgi:hypothetical protein